MEKITSRANERVKEIGRLCTEPAARAEKGFCVLFGEKLCFEALRLGVKLREVWFTQQAKEKSGAIEKLIESAAEAVEMSEGVDEKLSYQKTAQGVFAVAEIPKARVTDTPDRVIILDNVQDPVNVGAVIRSAAALGWREVILFAGTADAFSPRALRASMGAAFAVNISVCGEASTKIKELKDSGVCCVATALKSDSVPITEIDKTKRLALIIGNEGNGLSEETIDMCDLTAIIPISDAVESLNASAASAVAMWELRR